MNGGHGHVRPRADGVKARCGGPEVCAICQMEQTDRRARYARQVKQPAFIEPLPLKDTCPICAIAPRVNGWRCVTCTNDYYRDYRNRKKPSVASAQRSCNI